MQEKSIKNKELGDRGEDIACDYLLERGFRIKNRNFRGGGGEIDIIAERGKELHFIEVKARRGVSFGLPVEAVDKRKRGRIRKAAQMWLVKSKYNINSDNARPCYYDVIAVDLSADIPQIEFIEDAFI